MFRTTMKKPTHTMRLLVDPTCGIENKYAHTTLVCTDNDKQKELKEEIQNSELCHYFSSKTFYAQKVENFGSSLTLEKFDDKEIKYLKSISTAITNFPEPPNLANECRKMEFNYNQAKSLRDYLFDKAKNAQLAKKVQTNNWVVVLSLGDKEEEIREKLSGVFDKFMCPENNGVLYHWKLGEGDHQEAQLKQPHITIGPKDEDKLVAKQLIKSKTPIKFSQIDYKQLGPHDALFTLMIEGTHKTLTARV